MEHNLQNNLFTYATSELSQDAFLCYLASFALEGVPFDQTLTPCAKELMKLFVPELEPNTLTIEKIEKQSNHIDALFTVSCNGKRYKIILEDKTFTSHHDNQLKRYMENIKTKFPDSEVVGVYYKTGFESNMDEIKEAGYRVIKRADMLEFLEKYVEKTDNQIISQYYRYWNEFQIESDRYTSLSPEQWSWKQIYGFFSHLKESIIGTKAGFGYVPQNDGGFIGFWTIAEDNNIVYIQSIPFDLYLQIEISERIEKTYVRICLKAQVHGDTEISDSVSKARDELIDQGIETYKLKAYGFLRPERLRRGKSMTIGIFDKEYHTAQEIETEFIAVLEELDLMISDIKGKYC